MLQDLQPVLAVLLIPAVPAKWLTRKAVRNWKVQLMLGQPISILCFLLLGWRPAKRIPAKVREEQHMPYGLTTIHQCYGNAFTRKHLQQHIPIIGRPILTQRLSCSLHLLPVNSLGKYSDPGDKSLRRAQTLCYSLVKDFGDKHNTLWACYRQAGSSPYRRTEGCFPYNQTNEWARMERSAWYWN